MWYSAHAIFYFKCATQNHYLVHENIYLVEADTPDAAMTQAYRLAKSREDHNETGNLQIDGKPAQYLLAGIRKLIEVERHPDPAQTGLFNGVEVTYSELEVGTFDEVQQLAGGKILNVRLKD
jgi:hypothetical protein